MGKQRDKQGQVTLDDLAVMVQNGFMEMDHRFDGIDREITELKHQTTKLEHQTTRLEHQTTKLEQGQEEIQLKLSYVSYRYELETLENRVDHVERFLKLRK